ncbi:hypothetical protein ACFQU2_40090 [Siccirubricoccus deserti]
MGMDGRRGDDAPADDGSLGRTRVAGGRVDIAAIRDGRPYAAGWLRPAAEFRGPFRLILLAGATEIDFGGIAATRRRRAALPSNCIAPSPGTPSCTGRRSSPS